MDRLQLAALLGALLDESKKMKAEEEKYRETNKNIADYVSHKRMGFVLAMSMVLAAAEMQPEDELADAMKF